MVRIDPPLPIAALFIRKDSAYKSIDGVDCWDRLRNGKYWPGGSPLIAHPPCSQWGVLRHMARRDPDEKSLAVLSVTFVREFGGVLEHPRYSSLWDYYDLPKPSDCPDSYGGWTLEVDQYHWGHVTNKPTWLYIVGCPRPCCPPFPPLRLSRPTRSLTTGHGLRKSMPGYRTRVSDREREYTPLAFAQWLVSLARACKKTSYASD